MIEYATDFPDGHTFNADLCIIGAGAAGISMALNLIDSGLEILLLEAGDWQADPETQGLYAGTVLDERLHSPPDRYRERRFGGSTTIWGGRCMPFDDIDFEARDYLPLSGWPISPETLAPFYPQANRLCEAGEFTYTAESAFPDARRPSRPMMPGFSSSHFTTNTLERFSCPTNFANRYQHKLAASQKIRVLLRANVTTLVRAPDWLDPSRCRIDSLVTRTLNGRSHKVNARTFVLATGGLEVTRLLLSNRDEHGRGLGNENDLVGRHYMCHLAGTIGTMQFNEKSGKIWHGYDIADEGVYCRRRLALTADSQRQHGIGNFIARLHHPRITDPAHRTGLLSLLYLAKAFIPYEYGKRLHGEETASLGTWLQHVRNVMLDPFAITAFLWNWLNQRTLAERKFPSVIIHPRSSRYSLDFHAEQIPNPASRVMLSELRDHLGMPRLHIDWRYSQGDVDTVKTSLALLQADIANSGIGQFDYDPASVEEEMTRYGAYGGHHIGLTRMGLNPRSSVVNADCRVHSVANLYIASAATFPTSSQANPTLTIVAMALRLSAHLNQLMNRTAPDLSPTLPLHAIKSAQGIL